MYTFFWRTLYTVSGQPHARPFCFHVKNPRQLRCKRLGGSAKCLEVLVNTGVKCSLEEGERKLYAAAAAGTGWQQVIGEPLAPKQAETSQNKNNSHFTCKCNVLVNLLVPELILLILAHPVYRMWIIQEPNKLELWNKLHFEEKKTENIYTMFKIFGTYICWVNI